MQAAVHDEYDSPAPPETTKSHDGNAAEAPPQFDQYYYFRLGLIALDLTLISALSAMLAAGAYTLAGADDDNRDHKKLRSSTLFKGFLMTIGALYQLVFFSCYLLSHLHPLSKATPLNYNMLDVVDEEGHEKKTTHVRVLVAAAAGVLLVSAGDIRTACATRFGAGFRDPRVAAEGVYAVGSTLAGILIFVYRGYVRCFFPRSFGLTLDVLFLLLSMVWVGVQLGLVILRCSL